MVWRADDPQGDEAGKFKYLAAPYTRGLGIDVGCGPKKAFPKFIGVDNCVDTQLFGIPIAPDIKVESCETLPFDDGELDFVFSSHTLEHVTDFKRALAEWWRVVKPGGHLVLYLPHAELYPRIGEPGSNPDHKHDFLPSHITDAMAEVAEHTGMELLEDEVRDGGREYSFYQVYRKRDDGLFHVRQKLPGKTACVVRFGGYGDMIQAANVFPALKRQGFRITMMTTPKGHEIIQHDPHVDEWIVIDHDQIPNNELGECFKQWAPRFDRFVNLCESVEGTLLAMPGRANHGWPEQVRHRHLNQNYLEFTAELAQVPYKSESKFYPAAVERDEATGYVAEHFGDDAFVVVVALAGSSLHKAYPWMDNAMMRVLLDIPEARFVMVGDEFCRILEGGWESESRVRMESGRLTIRQTLALASVADCVVGPETGVLNAVAFDEAIGKVVLLSHSSTENLTKHWKNTVALTPPQSVACYPCHRLHYTDEFCNVHPEVGAAMCAFEINPQRVAEGIRRIHKRWRGRDDARRSA